MDRRDSEHIFSEFEDVERQRYIREIIAKNPSLGRVTRRSLFILWFSCKEILREWARQDAMSPINLALIGSRPDLESDVVGRIAKRKKYGLHDSSPTKRAQDPVNKALERDGERCLLTRHGRRTGVEVARIMPFSLHKTPRGGLWHWLDIFWGDQAKAWLQAIVGRDDRFNTEKTSNMISLNSLVHAHWDNSQCAFRVVRVADDELSMDVSFHWLPLEGGKQTEQVDLIRNPYGNGAHEDYRQSAGENFKVFNHETEKLIESGSIFTITTTDKEKHPLPSKGLLDLLWVLKRLAAMQGEGEGEEEEEEDDVESDKDSPAVPSLPPSRSPVTSPPPMRCSENLSLRNPRSRSSSPLKELGSLSLADRHTGSLIEESD